MKKILCLLLALLAALPSCSALADMTRFQQAPVKTRIYEGTTDQSVTLLYGDYRYTAGSIGLIYADRSSVPGTELPLMVAYFVHNGGKQNTSLTVTTDKKVYQVTKASDLDKTGVSEDPNAISVAFGPATIAMFRDMVKSKSVKITCGPAKNRFEIILTEQKKALLQLAVEEYTGHISKVYEAMGRADYIRYVERPAAEINVSNVKKTTASYKTLDTKSTGAAVKKLQRYLIYYKYLSGTADGKYSNKVAAAVKKFQKKAKIRQTGVADAATQKKLYAKEIPWKPAVTLAFSSIKTVNKVRKVFFCFSNVDCEYTVTGVKLVLRVLDAQGKVLAANGQTTFQYSVSKISMKPKTKRANAKDSAPLTAFPNAKTIQAGVVAYTLSTGVTVNVPTEKIQWLKIQ